MAKCQICFERALALLAVFKWYDTWTSSTLVRIVTVQKQRDQKWCCTKCRKPCWFWTMFKVQLVLLTFAFNCHRQSLLTRLSVSNLSPNDLLGVYQKCMGKIWNCRCWNSMRVFYQQCKGLMVGTIQGPTYKSASTSASNPHFECSLTHSQCHTQELLNANNLGTWVISETCLALCSEREWDSPFW